MTERRIYRLDLTDDEITVVALVLTDAVRRDMPMAEHDEEIKAMMAMITPEGRLALREVGRRLADMMRAVDGAVA